MFVRRDGRLGCCEVFNRRVRVGLSITMKMLEGVKGIT